MSNNRVTVRVTACTLVASIFGLEATRVVAPAGYADVAPVGAMHYVVRSAPDVPAQQTRPGDACDPFQARCGTRRHDRRSTDLPVSQWPPARGEFVRAAWFGLGVLGSGRRLGGDGNGEVGPITVLGAGESGMDEGDRLRTDSIGRRGAGPERGLEFGARSGPKRLPRSNHEEKSV